MQPTKTIAVIVRDEALLASLTFALGVEGFGVDGHTRWPNGLGARADIDCIVLDSENYRWDLEARDGAAEARQPVLFLSDSLSPAPEEPGFTTLGKPFQGGDLVECVQRLVGRTAALSR